MGFVGNGDQENWLMWTIFVRSYPKELKNLLDKHNSPVYSCLGIYSWQKEDFRRPKNLDICFFAITL